MQWFEKSRYLMTASKDKVLHIWEMPREWIREELPEGIKKDNEAVYKTHKLMQALEEETKYEAPPPKKEIVREKPPHRFVEPMDQDLDPLGASKFKAKDLKFTNDDDLSGWHM
mmetsp:Transcript_42928/g.50360  ORF Transcript_42928/g.50360 Transcript_42928/m.50360 type:complete len:113 (+) Transcript_42928:1328-1666(+)